VQVRGLVALVLVPDGDGEVLPVSFNQMLTESVSVLCFIPEKLSVREGTVVC